MIAVIIVGIRGRRSLDVFTLFTYPTYRIAPGTPSIFIPHTTYVNEGVHIIKGYMHRNFFQRRYGRWGTGGSGLKMATSIVSH